jgi:hypothetical protein
MQNPPVTTAPPTLNRNSRRNWILGAIIFLLLLAAVVSWAANRNSSSNSSNKGIANACTYLSAYTKTALNQTQQVSGLKLTVTKLTTNVVSAQNDGKSPGTQTKYLIADVTLEGSSDKPTNYSYAQFSSLSDSKTYAAMAPSALPPGIENPLGSGSLTNGGKTSGQVVVLVPNKYKCAYIVYAPTQNSEKKILVTP